MTPGHLLRVAIIVFLVLLLLGRRRRRNPGTPAALPGPGGPQQLGPLRTLPVHTPVTPVHVPEAFSSPQPPAFGPGADWNSTSTPDWNSGQAGGRPSTLSPAETDELAKLDSLRSSGTLTETAYLEARARLFGTAIPSGWSVTLLNAGSNKIHAIKALRECRRDLDLRGAKDLVDNAPQTLFRGLARAEAEQVSAYLQQAGVPAQLGPDA